MGKRANERRRSAKRRKSSVKNWIYFVITALVVISMGLGVTMAVAGKSSPTGSSGTPASTITGTGALADAIRRSPMKVQQAYAYVAQSPATMNYIPCYCGCGQHSGHRSANDCFVAARNPDGTVDYDPHGLGCDMCVDIAVMTRDLTAQGKSLAQVREAVTRKYSSLGPPTNTPPIP